MQILKKICALTLLVCMVFTLAACNSKDGQTAEKVKLENVYKAASIALPEGLERLYNYAVLDGRVYFISQVYDENTNVSKVQSIGLDGGEAETLLEVSNTYDPDATVHTSRNLQSVSASPDGFLWLSESEYVEDNSDPDNYVYENRDVLRKIDLEGNELGVIDLSKVGDDEYGFYVDRMIFDKDGNIYVSNNQKIYVFDAAKMELAFTVSETEYINSIISTGSGEVMYTMHDMQGMTFKKIDFAAQAAGNPISYTGNQYFYQTIPGSGEHDFYYTNEMGLYGFSLATMASTKVIDFINSDLDGNMLQNMLPLSDGRFLVAERDYRNWEFKGMLVLESVPDAEVVEKNILTFATMYMSQDVRRKIIEFNKASSEYRISILDYSQYSTNENYMAGFEQLNNDLIAGKVPDLIDLNNLQASNYISKGLLADLNPLIEADTELSRDMLLENVLEACSVDGKLYQLIPTFNIFSAVGKVKNVGSGQGWTVEDLKAAMAKAPEGATAFSQMEKSTFMMYSVILSLNEFVDWNAGTTSFNSPDFMGLLEIANSFPDSIDYQSLYNDYDQYRQMLETAYRDDKILLETAYVGNLRFVRDMKTQFAGEDINFVGFPTPSKNGSVISPNVSLAISSKTKHQEACWEFLRTLLLDEAVLEDRWQLPLNKNLLNKMAEVEMTPLKDRDHSNGVTITEYQIGGGSSSWTSGTFEDPEGKYKDYHLTQAEVDQMMQLITSVNTLLNQNQSIMEIITEEAAPYFAGKKSAQEVAEIIQNRIQIYVSESK